MSVDYRKLARQYAQQNGIDPDLFERQIGAESNFNPTAKSGAGAIGIAQIMPQTAAGWHVDPTNPEASLRAAAREMGNYQKKYGNYKDALVAYNAGPGRVGKPLFAETQAYVDKILNGAKSGAGAASLGAQTAPAGIQGVSSPANNMGTNVFDYLAATPPTATATGPLQTQLQAGWRLLSQLQNQKSAQAPAITNDGASGSVFTSTPFQEKTGKVTGVGDFEGTKVAGWISPILQYAREHGWKGSVNSGYRSFQDQTRIYNSGVRPAAKPGTSNHEGTEFPRGAVDVSDAAQLADILSKSPYRKRLVWAGAKDPVHFSFPHNGSY
jgi:hypothetical protein